MKTLTIAALFACICIASAYFAGAANGRAKCEKNQAASIITAQIKTETLRKKINAKVNSSSSDDIRSRLREEYTLRD
ncbi:MAG: hypothetical protein LBB23_02980 [Rickettsiales bacterium]|jgi:hypothetical protein|nr:hypothetical protein [Rickettsiales bacterium]